MGDLALDYAVSIKSEFVDYSPVPYRHTFRIVTGKGASLGLRFGEKYCWGVYSTCCNAGLHRETERFKHRYNTSYCKRCFKASAYGDEFTPVCWSLNDSKALTFLTHVLERHHDPLVAPLLAWDLQGLACVMYRDYEREVKFYRPDPVRGKPYRDTRVTFREIAEQHSGQVPPRPDHVKPAYG